MKLINRLLAGAVLLAVVFIGQEINPEIILSSQYLEQADILVIKIPGKQIDELSGTFDDSKIDLFEGPSSDLFAIIGIDAKKAPGKYNLEISFTDGYKIEKTIEVRQRHFPVTKMIVTQELQKKGYTASKIMINIADNDNPTINKILSGYTPEAIFDESFAYPLKEIKDIGAYGNIRKSETSKIQHLGTDLEADEGTPVFAVNNGVVKLAKKLDTYGNTLIIDHGLGIFSLYLHLSEFKVSPGQSVNREEIVALSGNTGYSIAPHLHFSIKINGSSVDPLKFIEIAEKEIK
ncbi:MAG: M23 family metallopeptidase [Candidatus Parcubacteria bacterium]|nr:M23 family metallopeptidase [Candidatus Parcubacteria bacterium]